MSRALMSLFITASLASLALSACAKPNEPPRVLAAHLSMTLPLAAPSEEAQLSGCRIASRTPAEAAFDRHCGSCHRSDRDTAKPAALAIFDLTHAAWQTGLTEKQLNSAIGRFKGKSEVTDDERSAASSLVESELARRKACGQGG